MKDTIITVSRAYGSGGHRIGERLAEELGIPYYDNESISLVAERSGLSKEIMKNAESIPTTNILYSLSRLGPSAELYGMPLGERIFSAQSEAIRELASKGSCVIIGRCADYVLKDFEDCIHIFITASLPKRVKRAVAEYQLFPENAEKKVTKTDRSRELYYNYHTGLKWGDPLNYDMIINTDYTGLEDAVMLIKSYVQLRKNAGMQKPEDDK